MDPQDQTFMTIHNLTPDANILFASESIIDILGYQPSEVLNKSAFDYFHPAQVKLARSVHSRGVRLDKAAVLHYVEILSRDGRWVNCECCFTVVHDVLVASTSIYNRGANSQGRAERAPQIRRLFSSSPRDPRYHMLEHLSPKFKMPPTEREPRAALVLNRFTRNLSIMFATTAVTNILGLRPDELLDRPFYHCIQENCLAAAIDCLERAKKNESIAYLRFWFRDPRQDDLVQRAPAPDDDDDTDMATEDDDDDDDDDDDEDDVSLDGNSVADGGNALDSTSDKGEHEMEVDGETGDRCRAQSAPERRRSSDRRTYPTPPPSDGIITPHSGPGRDAFELEAVVSCTSDGLVVVLRKARPPIPDPQLPLIPAFNHANGLFAAPWGQQPIEPHYPHELVHQFQAPYAPSRMPVLPHVKRAGGPPREQLMNSIRDDAVFAWGLVGINQGYADYGHGQPGKGSQPADGLRREPIPTRYEGPQNLALDRTANLVGGSAPMASGLDPSHRGLLGASHVFGHPGTGYGNTQHGLRGGLEVQGSLPVVTPDDPYHSTRVHHPGSSTRRADLNDFDDPLDHRPAPASSSSRAPLVSGTIGSSSSSAPTGSNSGSGGWTSRIPGEDRRAPTNTIDESVWDTLRRDLLAVWSKMREVLYPRYLLGGDMNMGSMSQLAGRLGSVDVDALLGQNHMTPGLRDWDLWGPLLFCLALSALLSVRSREEQRGVVFSGVFAMVWVGEAVVTMQIKLLGGNISFAQSVCIIGYTLFPLVLAALLSALGLYWIARIPVYLLLVGWSMAAGVSILGGSGVVKNRVGLAVYPLFVFYLGLGCLCFIS
ncbi:hypothetical protein QBC39DRAFT_392726 [Podospora conica]|nr:hypothetical protein QBC39DRAFT_392726 [Schizothecium conicum]